MPSTVPTLMRLDSLASGVVRAYRGHAARARGRREHDFVMADHRFAIEHRAQRDRAIAQGHGGCPYCDGAI